MRLKEVKRINRNLLQDVYNVVGGIYRMNAPYSKGYLFTPRIDRKEIARGMFCDSDREINKDEWDYYFEFSSRKFYKIA